MTEAFRRQNVCSPEDIQCKPLYREAASISYERRHGQPLSDKKLAMPQCGRCQDGFCEQAAAFLAKVTQPV